MLKKSLFFGSVLSMFYLYPMDFSKSKAILKPIIEQIQRVVQSKKSSPPFIAIDGCSSVGKSYFTSLIKKELGEIGINAIALNVDDFHNHDHVCSENFHPLLDHLLLHSCIQDIQKGKQLVKKLVWRPRELRPPHKKEEVFSVEGVDVVLFEGEFTLSNKKPYDFSQYSEFGIFLDANDEDIVEWNWQRKRDVLEGETYEKFALRASLGLKKYRSYLKSSLSDPLFLISKDRSHNYQLK